MELTKEQKQQAQKDFFRKNEYELKEFIIKDGEKHPVSIICPGGGYSVVCSFVVNPDGSISHLCVIKGCHELLNEEAMRIIKAMPQWVAGKMGNDKVAVRCILPIAFRL